MPTWLTAVLTIITALPQIAPELEAFIQALMAMANGSGTAPAAHEAARTLVGAVAANSAK